MTNRNAAALHRRMDHGFAEALAREGGELTGWPGPLIPPRLRRQDMRTMNRQDGPRVLLLQLSERTSSRGTRYFSGWFGKARLVGFLAEEPDRDGNPLWNVYAAEPAPRPAAAATEAAERRSSRPASSPPRGQSARQRGAVPDGEPFPDDPLDDIGRR